MLVEFDALMSTAGAWARAWCVCTCVFVRVCEGVMCDVSIKNHAADLPATAPGLQLRAAVLALAP